MAITEFAADELVSRANVNSRITQANTEITQMDSAMKGVTLYDNPSGTLSTIQLADDFSNYDLIKVYWSHSGKTGCTEAITNLSSTIVNLAATGETYSQSNYYLNVYAVELNFVGTTATFNLKVQYAVKSGATFEINRFTADTYQLSVVKIVGYKY